MKLLDLPVFSEVVAFVDGLYGSDMLCLRTASKEYNEFVTHHPSMRPMWYTLLRRASHNKICTDNPWRMYYDMEKCYPPSEERYKDTLKFVIVHKDILHTIRKNYGECCQEKHYRYKVQPPDPVHGFTGRDLYSEWQEFMWRRKKREYWSSYDEKKFEKLRQGLEVLTKKKELAANMVEYYGGLKKKRMSQQKKNKKNKK